jgi:hypothetical protein
LPWSAKFILLSLPWSAKFILRLWSAKFILQRSRINSEINQVMSNTDNAHIALVKITAKIYGKP